MRGRRPRPPCAGPGYCPVRTVTTRSCEPPPQVRFPRCWTTSSRFSSAGVSGEDAAEVVGLLGNVGAAEQSAGAGVAVPGRLPKGKHAKVFRPGEGDHLA